MKLFVNMLGWTLRLCSLLALTLVLSGCRTIPPDAAPPKVVSDTSDVLHVGDVVMIGFSGTPEPPPRHEDRINEEGMITLPFMKKPFLAAGKTRTQMQNEIHDLYVPAYYARLTVTVNPDVRTVSVWGQVKLGGGQYAHHPQLTVLKAIASAGGFNDFANQKKVQLRHSNGKAEIINCVKALANPALDRPVLPGDQIYVPRRYF